MDHDTVERESRKSSEWTKAAQNLYLAGRTSTYCANVPSEMLEEMRDVLLAAAALATPSPAPTGRGEDGIAAAPPAEPIAQWEDSRVQKVYEMLVSEEVPPLEQHWEGWVARRIVDALAARGAAPQGEPVVTQPRVIAYEFLHSNGHAIVDYSEHTHVGHLTREKGYAKHALVYANAAPPVVGSAGAAPQQGGGGVPAGEAEAFEVWLKEARELAAESTKQAILHQFAIDDPDISESALDSARDATTKATAKFHAHLRQRAAAPSTPAAGALSLSDEPKSFEGYLCRAWGETDLPCAEVVQDLEGIRRFMVREWLGEEDATDYDGTPTLNRVMEEIESHDWRGEGEWSIEFEIGGVSVELVYSFARALLAGAEQGQKP